MLPRFLQHKRNVLLSGTVLAVLATVVVRPWHWLEPEVDFNTQIKPILNKNCIACHGGVKKAEGFSVLFRHEALAATKSGKPAIIPGHAGDSEMIRRLTLQDPEQRMPLDAPPLKEEEIELLRKWIDQGAKWGDHWAYQTPQRPELPENNPPSLKAGFTGQEAEAKPWGRNPVDLFVLEKRNAEGLKPSPEAPRETLLRRVSLDLTGLPPTPQLARSFLADTSAGAYEKLVDSLLASPAYGEKWAATWLDLARYSDTKGYERDGGRQIWRYRDWLIKAFNQDKPYDQFTIEQLAGDLLPNPTDDQLVATGFHRNTMNNDEGGTQDEEFRVAAVMDRVNTTWDAFGGTTFSCVQCHSHPYDPFVNKEYYQYMAFFNNTRDEDVTSETPTLRFYKPEDSLKLEEVKTWIAQHKAKPEQVRDLVQFVRVVEPKINSHDFDSYQNASLLDAKYFGFQHGGSARIKGVDLAGKSRLVVAWGTNVRKATVTVRRDSANGPVVVTLPVPKTGSEWNDTTQLFVLPPLTGKRDLYLSLHGPRDPKKWVMIKWVACRSHLPGQAADKLDETDRKLIELLNAEAETTPVMLDGTGMLARKTHAFVRGNWLVKGAEVTPAVPKSLPPMAKELPRNRLGLARWMTSRQHPLTARVAVNRFWEQLFGTGLVETAEDFGTQGIPPTHRELLDWLAVEFMETHGWSVKKLLRQLVLSATYRQRSEVSPEGAAKDPANRLLARGPRVRLSAETIRDQALAVSGLLSPKLYGPPVMPPQPEGIWQSPYNGEKWKTVRNEDSYRRALYTYWKRTAPYPSMVTFDSPSREFCQVRRIRTNTPLQALVTLNDTVYLEASRKLADWMNTEETTPDRRIGAAYRRVMVRDITPAKRDVLVRLYHDTEKHYRANLQEACELIDDGSYDAQRAALTVVANTLLNLDEVITKE
ncbi:MAG: DUF1553 domain-containing protein [Cytophagales bacterium]|nr:DUF1553 domain-containing protein [Cytophagales bacterium]